MIANVVDTVYVVQECRSEWPAIIFGLASLAAIVIMVIYAIRKTS